MEEIIVEESSPITPEFFGNGALAKIISAETDTQISTAKRFPRSVTQFKRDAKEMACLDEETAMSCFYSLPRDGKNLEGPSVRLAEIVQSCWGNIKAGSRVIDDDGKMVTAQGFCWDLQRNVQVAVEVKRRVTKKDGKRYSDDMIVVACNAACAIAFRNAVFKVIPMAFVREVYLEAKRCAIGDAKTLTARRQKMVDSFAKIGVDPTRIFARLEKKGIEDITLDDLGTMIGLWTAIKEGDISVDEAFPDPKAAMPPPAPGKHSLKGPPTDPKPAPAPEPKPTPPVEQPKTEPKTEQSWLTEEEVQDLWNDLHACATPLDFEAAKEAVERSRKNMRVSERSRLDAKIAEMAKNIK